MPKQTSLWLKLFVSTLSQRLARVFFAIFWAVILTPVIFFTRVYARASAGIRGRLRVRVYARGTASVLMGLAIIVTLGVSLTRPAQTNAAVSDNLNFQARLENSNGAIAPDGNYNVQFKLYNASTGGSALWTESYLNSAGNGIRVVNGYLTANLGAITPFPSTIAWDQNLYITMNIGGTTTGSPSYDGEMNPRLKLTSVPYAFQAKSADQLQVSNSGNTSTLSFTTPTANNSILLPDASGTVCLAGSNNCGFASSSGSSSYIQNGSTLQTGANFYIQSAGTGTTTAVMQALTGQTANLLQFRDASGTALSGFNASGQLYYQSGSFTGTLVQDSLNQNTTYHLPDPGGSTATICLTTGNCAGTGGGITGSGTTNYVARFNSSGSINASSLLYDNNTFVGVNTTTNSGQLSVVSSNASQVGAFVQAAASATKAVLVLKGGATPATGGDLLQLMDNGGTVLAKVDAAGNVSTTGTLNADGATTLGSTLSVTGDATFLANASVQGGSLTVGVPGTTTGGITLASGGSNFATTLRGAGGLTANQTINIPASSATTDTVCLLTLSNCVGAGGSVSTSGGTQNYITKYTNASATQLGNSALYDNGSFIGLNTTTNNGLFSIQGASTTQGSLFVQGMASATAATATIRAGASQTGNLLQFQSSNGATNLAWFDSGGALRLSTTAGSRIFATGTGGSLGGSTATIQVQPAGATNEGILIRGQTSQTADLLQFQNSSGTVIAKIDAAGSLTAVDGNFTGNVAQTGSGTFSTGTGNVSLNGNTSITGVNTLTVGTGATSLGGTLGVSGLTTLSAGADITGATNINTTGTAGTTIGNSASTLTINAPTTLNGTGYINTNNTSAFKVENSAGTGTQLNTLVVDTANGKVGLGAAPTSGGALLQVAGSIATSGTSSSVSSQSIFAGTNVNLATSASNDGRLSKYAIASGALSVGDVVVRAGVSGANETVSTTTTARDNRIYGVILFNAANNATANVAITGNVTVNAVSGTGTAIAVGDQLVTSGSAGKVMVDNNATTGILGYASTTKNDAGTTVGVMIRPVNGQTNPSFAGTITVQGSGTSVFTGTVQGADATANNQFLTLGQANSLYTATGSGSYIQNGTTQQTANFNIISASASSVAAVIQAASGQSTDILQVKSGVNNFLAVSQNGETRLGYLGYNDPLNGTNASLKVGSLNTSVAYGIIVSPSSAATKGILIQAKSGQTGNLLELKDSLGNILSSLTGTGALQGGNATGTDTAGTSISVNGGQGTGTGVGGNINFGIAKAGTTGSTNNTLSTVASISGADGSALFKNATDSSTGFQIQNASGTGVLTANTSTGDVTINQGNLTVSPKLAAPTSVTLSSAATGGSLAANTYYYGVAAINATGTTNVTYSSPTSVVTTGSTSVNTVSWSTVSGATGYRVYRSTNGYTWSVTSMASGTTSLIDNGTTYNWSTGGSPQNLTNTTGGGVLNIGNSIQMNGATVLQFPGLWNSFIGASTGNGSLTGIGNVALGRSNLSSVTSGSNNNAIGTFVLQGLTTGANNTAIGSNSLNRGTGAVSNNTAVGTNALYGTTTGNNNTALGNNSGQSNTTGTNNTFLGFYSGFVEGGVAGNFTTGATLQNATAIGYNAQVQGSNQLVLGGTGAYQVNVGIGTTNPDNILSVSPIQYSTGTATRTNGSAAIVGTGTTWTSAMVGSTIVFADGFKSTVASFTDATHITMAANATTTDASPVQYRIHYAGLQVNSSGQLGVGTTAPAYGLDVVTASAISAQFSGRVIGANAVSNNEFLTLGQANSLYAAGSGTGNYIQNGTTQQTANFNIASASASSVAAVIQGASGQSVDILQVYKNGTTTGLKVDSNGSLSANAAATFSNSGNTGTFALRVNSGVSAIPAAVIYGAASQTSDLLQFRTNTDTILSSFTAAGALQGGGGVGTDAAGLSLAINGGRGTGTGAGGSINFSIAKPGTTGSAANALGTVFSLSGTNGSALFQNATDSSTAFQVQNTAGTAALNVNTSTLTTTFRAGTDTTTLGSNLITTTDFTNAAWTSTGWTTTSTTATHNTGNTNALSTGQVTPVSGTTYQISYTVSGPPVNASTLTTTFGGVTVDAFTMTSPSSYSSFTQTKTITATSNTGNLTFTPDTTFNGAISNVSVKIVSQSANPALVVQNASGNASIEVRASSSTTNSFIGLSAGASNTTGVQIVALGSQALQNNTSGVSLVGVGYQALQLNTSGSSNTAVGNQTLAVNTVGSFNTAIGSVALQSNTTGNNNTAVGVNALKLNTFGAFNTALGTNALGSVISGNNNVGIGSNALANATGNGNTALGVNGLNLLTTGSSNLALGVSSGRTNVSANATTTGSNNTFVGSATGQGISQYQVSNSTAIGLNSVVNQSNAIILGCTNGANGCTTTTSVGIGSQYAPNALTVSAGTYGTYGTAGSSTTITQTGTTITGSGTAFTISMNGGTIYYADGTTATVAYVNATTLTSSVSKTVSAGSTYTIAYGGFNVTANGSVYLQPTVDTTTAFRVSNAANNNPIFTVDSTNQTVGVGGNSAAIAKFVVSTGAYNAAVIDQNGTAGSFDILQLKGNGTTVATFSNTGKVLFQNLSDSSNAFRIQTQGGTDLLNINTSTQQLAVGPAAVPANGVLTIGTSSTTTNAGGLYFGTDTTLYRSGSGVLATDGALAVYNANANQVSIGRTAAGTPGAGITFGSGQDTNLYRSAADTLKTDDSLVVGTNLSVTGTSTLTGLVTAQNGLTIQSGSQFTNASSTLFTSVNLGQSTGTLTASSTVDVTTTLNINQTSSATITLPNPTVTTSGRILYVNNVGSASFTMSGNTIAPGNSASFMWNGTAWVTLSSSSTASSTGVNTIGAINGQTKSADGAVISGSTLYLQSADASFPGLVTIGAQTLAGDKTLTGLTTLSGGLTATGAVNINTTGTANTAIGNSTGTFSVASNALNITAAGAISGVTTLSASGLISTTGSISANTNSTTALKIEQNGVKNNVLVVDTQNGLVGIGLAPSTGLSATLQTNSINASNWLSTNLVYGNVFAITSTAQNSGTINKKYTMTTSSLAVNDVVIFDGTNAAKTTTARDSRVVGVVVTADTTTTTYVATSGYATVNAVAGAIAVGDQLVTSTTAGSVAVDNTATTGIVGYATSTKGAAAGTVSIRLAVTAGQTNPSFAGNITVQGTGTSVFNGTVQGLAATANDQFVTLGQANTNYAPASGSANYIQNQNATAQSADLYIKGTSASAVAAKIVGNSNAGSVDVFQALQSDGGNGIKVSSTGQLTATSAAIIGNAGKNGTTALQVNNSGNVATTVALTVTGGTGQTADLVQFKSNSSTVMSSITAGGALQGANASGTDTAGTSLAINGGQGTGTGSGGSINFGIAKAAASTGSTNNAISNVLSLSGSTGAAVFRNATNSGAGFQVQNAGTGGVFTVNTSNNQAYVNTGIAGSAFSVTNSQASDTAFAANQSGTGSIADFKTGGTSVLTLGNNGSALFKNGTDSSTGFRIQSTTNTDVLTADTSANKIGIGIAPNTAANNGILQVGASGTYGIAQGITFSGGGGASNGTSLYARSAAVLGTTGGFYIAGNNQITGNLQVDNQAGIGAASSTTQQLLVQSTSASAIGAVIKGAASQSGDLLQLQTNGSTTPLAAFNASGNLTLGNSANVGKLLLADGSTSNLVTLQAGSQSNAVTLSLPTNIASTDTICLQTKNNCANANAVTTTTGQANYVARFTGANTIGIGQLYDTGTATYVGGTTGGGLFNVGSSNQFQVSSAGAVTAVGVNSGSGLIQGTGGTTITGTTSINGTTSGTTAIGSSTAGAVSIASGAASSFVTTGAALTLTGGAASTFSTSAGALTVQGFGGVNVNTPVTNTASTNSGSINILSGNATGTTSNSGNVTIDAGTATGTVGTVSVGTTNSSVINIGRSASTATIAGTVKLSALSTGVVLSDATGQLSAGTVNLASSSYVSGTLGVANGGTGAATLTANGILFGNGTSAIQATAAAANSVLVTNGSNVPSLSQTLPSAVQGNITALGTIALGVNVASGQTYSINGTSINTAGTLNNVAYLNQANTFTGATNTFDNAVAVKGSGGLTLGITGTTAGKLVLASPATGGSVTLQTATGQSVATTLTIPTAGATDTICLLTANNCAVSGGVTTTTGQANYVARFTGANTIGIGQLYDTGTATYVGGTTGGGLFNVGSSNQFQVSSAGAVTAVGVDSGSGLIQGTGGLTVSGTSLFGGQVRLNNAAGTRVNANNKLVINTVTTQNASTDNAQIQVATGGIDNAGVVIQTTSGQTRSPFIVQNSAGTYLAGIDQTGNVIVEQGGAFRSLDTTGSLTSSNVTLRSGNSGGTSGTSGNVTIDVGTANGSVGQINIGTATANNITISRSGGTVKLANLGTGVVQSSSTGQLSSGTVDLSSSSYVSGTLAVANGGTGAATLASNGILYGNGTSAVQATTAAANSVLVTNGSNVPSLSQTLPSAVQGNITALGTIALGVNVASGQTYSINGASINTAGTLNNVAYLNQANTFTGATNTFDNAVVVKGSSGLTLGVAGTTAGKLVLASPATGGSVTLQTASGQSTATVLTIPVAGATDTVCLLTANNCAASGGVTTTTGQANYVARFTGATTLGIGQLYDTGTAAYVGGTTGGGLFNVGSSNQFQVSSAGAVTAVGINSGSGLIQGTGGATITGTTSINGTTSGTTTIGSSAAGGVSIASGAASSFVTSGAALTLTGGAASTFSTSAGALTLQGFSGINLNTPATGTASTNSGSVSIQSGNATGATSNSGNITVDAGTATGTAGTVSIGTTNASAVNIGRSASTSTIAGTVKLSALTTGVVLSDATGQLSSGTVNLASSSYVAGTLGVANGGTGATTLAANGILYGNGTSAIQATAAAADSILATNGSNVPSLTQTLPTAVQGNIVRTGALANGSIASGFGTISTGNTITTTTTVQGATVNATSAIQLGGANINTAGTLTNVAYLNQANTFTAANTFSSASGLTLGQSGPSGNSGRLNFANAANTNMASLYVAAPTGTGTAAYTIPAIAAGSTDTICLATLANCSAIGSAGGDLTGTYPNPTIASLQGKTLTVSATPTTGSVLQYNGSAFVDAKITNTNLTAGTFGAITGTGALQAGSITSGFGTISTANTITTSAAIQGGSFNNTGNSFVVNGSGAITAVSAITTTGGYNQSGTSTNNFSGATTIDNTLSVTSTSSHTGLATFNGGISVATNSNFDQSTSTGTFKTGTGAVSLNGTTTVTGTNTLNLGSTAGIVLTSNATYDQSASAGTFKTGTGAVSLNGDTMLASGKNLAVQGASSINLTGTSSFDQSASSGTFKTGTGAVSLSGNTTVTGTNTFTVNGGSLTSGSSGVVGKLVLTTAGTGAITLQSVSNNNNIILSIPAATGNDTICLQSLGNCTASGGALGGSGTTNRVARFTSSGVVGDGSLYDTGAGTGAVYIGNTSGGNAGSFNVGSSNQFNVSSTGAVVATSVNYGSGALQGTGNISQTGGATFSTATGNVSLNGNTSVTTGRTFTVADSLTTLGGGVNFTGAVSATATNSLLQIGSAIVGGNAVADGGTYIGLNAPNTGTGSAADFINFQKNGTTQLKVTNAGAVTATGLITGVGLASGTGQITGSGGINVGGAGFSFAGGTGNLNVNSNNATNINTGSSNGLVTIGNSANTTAISSGTLNVSTNTINLTGSNFATTAGILHNSAAGVLSSSLVVNADLQAGTFTNITGTGALSAGSIASGFGTISTGNNIGTSATVSGGTVTASGALQGNTLSINSGTFAVSATGAITASTGIATSGGHVQTGTSINTFTGATTFSATGTAVSVTNGTLSVTNNTTTGTLGVTNLATVGSLQIGATANQAITAVSGAGNHGFDIGRTDNTASSPYVDFHSGTTGGNDYDARLSASGGTASVGGATLTATAATFATSNNFTVGGTTQSFVGAGTIQSATNSNLTIQSQGTGQLNLASGNGTIGLGATTNTIQRTASGNTTLDLNDSGTTTFIVKNSGAGVANLNLFGGSLQTGATPVTRLDNAGNLLNIGTITSLGNASINATGAGTTSIGGTSNTGAITIGNSSSASLTMAAGSGGIVASTSGNISLTASGTATLALETNTGNISLGNSAVAKTLNIGNTTGATAVNVNSGTGGINLTPSGGSNSGITIQPNSNSTSLFKIQSASAADVLLNIDSTNNRIKVGNNTGTLTNTTLFQVDMATTAPTSTYDATLRGAMYFDTTADTFMCYNSAGWGACGASPDISVNLVPEYVGAVLNGSKFGSNNVGTLTSDLCSNGTLALNTTLCANSGEDYNYYAWNSPQANAQSYSIYVRYQLPATFKTFNDDNTIKLTARSSDVSTNSTGSALQTGVQYSMYYTNTNTNAVTACGSTTQVTTTADTWQTVSLGGSGEKTCTADSGVNGGIGPNTILTFKIDVTSKSGSNAYVSNLSFLTKGK